MRALPKPTSCAARHCSSMVTCSTMCAMYVPSRRRSMKPPTCPGEQRCSASVGTASSSRSTKPGTAVDGTSSSASRSTTARKQGAFEWMLGPRSNLRSTTFMVQLSVRDLGLGRRLGHGGDGGDRVDQRGRHALAVALVVRAAPVVDVVAGARRQEMQPDVDQLQPV